MRSEIRVWAKSKYRAHPNTYKRIMTSLSSAVVFFGKLPVSAIDAASVDDYKSWRAEEHEVRDVTIRHDLHAMSTFFQYAVRHHWAFSNPIEESISLRTLMLRGFTFSPSQKRKTTSGGQLGCPIFMMWVG